MQQPKEASEKLLATPWAKGLSPATDLESWKPFILGVLKQLQNADKSNWHHRIVLRVCFHISLVMLGHAAHLAV